MNTLKGWSEIILAGRLPEKNGEAEKVVGIPVAVVMEENVSSNVSSVEKIKRKNFRKMRNQAMRDLGLTKVKGSLGGIYWE